MRWWPWTRDRKIEDKQRLEYVAAKAEADESLNKVRNAIKKQDILVEFLNRGTE